MTEWRFSLIERSCARSPPRAPMTARSQNERPGRTMSHRVRVGASSRVPESGGRFAADCGDRAGCRPRATLPTTRRARPSAAARHPGRRRPIEPRDRPATRAATVERSGRRAERLDAAATGPWSGLPMSPRESSTASCWTTRPDPAARWAFMVIVFRDRRARKLDRTREESAQRPPNFRGLSRSGI